MGYESETDTFFYLSGIEGEDLSFMSFSYYPQDTQKDGSADFPGWQAFF